MAQFIKLVTRDLLLKKYIYNGTCKVLCSSYSKVTDLAKQTTSSPPDILLQNLKHAKSVGTVLEIVGTHQKIMNSKHILQALRSVFALQKQGDADISMQQILRHPYFEALCRSLKSKAGVIEVNETIEALKVVFYLGVKADSTIVQVLLQLVRHNLNNLSLHHIMFLDFLLMTKSNTPLVDALKMALPLVFEIQCNKKMDRENIVRLAEYFHYASKSGVSQKCIEDIMFAILQCREPLDSKTAKSIVWSITNLPPYEFLEPLLKKSLTVLSSDLTDMSYSEMETTFTKVLQKVTKKNYFYDEEFVNACVNSAIEREVGYTEALHVARKLTRVSHHNRYILDYLAGQVFEYPNLILKGDPLETYILINCFALTDNRPVHWNDVKEIIETAENITQCDRRQINWLKFASSLSSLGIFRKDVLELAFREDIIMQMLSKNITRDIITYLSLCQCIKLQMPDLVSLIPHTLKPENVIQNLRKPLEFPLESSLYVAFGGANYVSSNLMSRTGSLIDHMIVFRTGGYPVALNSDAVEFIEDLPISKDQQIAVIIGLTDGDLTINTKCCKSTTSSRLKSLEAEGLSVVPIDLELWSSLPDFEKIPYLVQAIKAKSAVEFTVSVDVG